MRALAELTGAFMRVCHNAYLARLGATPTLVVAGCALVGSLVDVVQLERVVEQLRCAAHAATLQGENKFSLCFAYGST